MVLLLDYLQESTTQQHVVAPEPASHEEKGKSKEEEEQTHDCLKAKKVKLMSCDRTGMQYQHEPACLKNTNIFKVFYDLCA
jgi:hypothetical protein